MSDFTRALRADGFPPENESFVRSLEGLEGAVRHPLYTRESDHSSDDEYTEDEASGALVLLSRREARRRINARNRQSTGQPQPQPKDIPGKSAKVSAVDDPMEGVEEFDHGYDRPRKALPTSGYRQAEASVNVGTRPARSPAKAKLGPVPPPPRLPPAAHSAPPQGHIEAAIIRTVPQKRQVSTSPPLTLSSSDGDDIQAAESPPLKTLQPVVAKTAGTTAPKRPKTASKAPKPTIGRGKKQRVMTLKEAVDRVTKLKNKVTQEFATISDLIDHYDDLERPTEAQYLSGLRICFVNPIERSNLGVMHKYNWMDQVLAQKIGLAVLRGADLVKPEDFFGAPADTRPTEEWRAAADAQGWTTHVVPLRLPFTPIAEFNEILACLGRSGISASQLGTFVRVVEPTWLTDSHMAKQVEDASKSEYRVLGHPAFISADAQEAEQARQVAQAEKAKGKERARNREEREEESGVTTEDEVGSNPESVRRASISSFGSQDFPAGELPSQGWTQARLEHERQALETTAAESTSQSDDQQHRTPSAQAKVSSHRGPDDFADYEGLEEQMACLDECGTSIADDLLDADERVRQESRINRKRIQLDPDLMMILSSRDAGPDTDEEDETRRGALAQGSDQERKKKDRKIRPGKGKSGYVCEHAATGGGKVAGPNDHVAEVLEQLAADPNKGDFQRRGYKNAAGILRNWTDSAITTQKEAQKIHGIGASIAEKIAEIVRTGTYRRLSMRTAEQDLVAVFAQIYGVGHKTGQKFYDDGARSLEDLRADPKRFRLTEAQKLGLEYFSDLQQRIPRSEVKKLYEHAVAVGKSSFELGHGMLANIATFPARDIDSDLQVHCMGSYRRGQKDCGDIDLLVTRSTDTDGRDHRGMIVKLWNGLVKRGIARHALTEPDDWGSLDAKVNALCALPGGMMRRLDILGVPWDEMPAALIYFTGNDWFNRSMRLKARELGYRLNQRGLYKDVSRDPRTNLKITEGVKVHCPTEGDIFKVLGVKWRPPEQRRP